jgi:hypothetical protein
MVAVNAFYSEAFRFASHALTITVYYLYYKEADAKFEGAAIPALNIFMRLSHEILAPVNDLTLLRE